MYKKALLLLALSSTNAFCQDYGTNNYHMNTLPANAAPQEQAIDGPSIPLNDAAPIASNDTFSNDPYANVPEPAKTQMRIAKLEEHQRRLEGQLDELRHQNATLSQEFQRLQNDLELRFQQMNGTLGGTQPTAPNNPEAPSTLQAQAAAGTPTKQGAATNDQVPGNTLSGDAAQQAYEQALTKIKTQDFAGAEKAFRQFLKNNPKHKLAGNAQFWVGESLFARSKFKEATPEYLNVYKKYPKNNKAPEALLKLAKCFAGMKNNKNACASLSQMDKAFPEQNGNVKQQSTALKGKLGCKK